MSVIKPVYLLAGGRPGGRDNTTDIIRSVMEASGKKSPVVAYSGTANGDDANFFHRMAGMIRSSGAADVVHAVISPRNADLDKARKILEAADVVFISGGDVDGGMKSLEEKKMTDFFEDLYNSGRVFFGASAGAIMLAKEWVRWPDPEDAENSELFPCLNFAPVICDCHDEQGGWQELVAALELKEEGTVGYGLVSGTGIRVDPDGSTEALGSPVHRYIREKDGVKRISDLVQDNIS